MCFSIACGYADGDGPSRLGKDPAFKLLTGWALERRWSLASQSTLSRLKNSTRRRNLLAGAQEFAAALIERQLWRRQRVRRIVIDFDPTHGGQRLSRFSRSYDTT